MKRGGSTCYRGAPKCGVNSNMADGPSFHPSWKQQGGSRTLDYSKWDGGPNQNPGAFWPFTGNAGVYTQLEASTPYGDSGEKVRGPRLGGINVRPGQIQGNPGERLQLLSTQAGGKKKSKGKSKTKTKSKPKKTKKSESKKSKKSKTSTRKSRSKKNQSWIDSLKFCKL